MATFGERVKELRKEKGQTMREVVDGVKALTKKCPRQPKQVNGSKSRGIAPS